MWWGGGSKEQDPKDEVLNLFIFVEFRTGVTTCDFQLIN